VRDLLEPLIPEDHYHDPLSSDGEGKGSERFWPHTRHDDEAG
jgi:hypothetical protein